MIEKRIQEAIDAGYHAHKQGLEMNPINCYLAFKEQWKYRNGSNKQFINSPEYESKEQQKHDYAMNNLWAVIEMKCKHDQIYKILRDEK